MVVTSPSGVHTEILVIAIINSLSFLVTFILVKNRPDKIIERINKVEWSHAKMLWRNKFMSYNLVALSVYLGVSWSFQGQCNFF